MGPAEWTTILVALLALGGTVITVVAAWLVALNRRLQRLERRDRLSWIYIRSLIDHAYKNGAVPLPEPPDGWLDETE